MQVLRSVVALFADYVPQEVTAAMAKDPEIADIAVYGVDLPRHEGKAGCACIVPKSGVSLNLHQLFEHAVQSLPKYAVPLFIRVTNEIPKLENNKHVKAPLAKEGVDPKKVSAGDRLYWLRDGVAGSKTYVQFTELDWSNIETGNVSL